METAFQDRLIESRENMGYSHRQAAKAMKEAERAGFGKAVAFGTIWDHETTVDRMPGADVVLCYGATYRRNPIWLVSGLGPREWEPEQYAKGGQRAFLAEVRKVARWMLTAAEEDGPIASVLREEEMPPKDERQGKGRSVGTPRENTG